MPAVSRLLTAALGLGATVSALVAPTAAVAAPSVVPAAAPTATSTAAATSTNKYDWAAAVYRQINDERKQNGLPALKTRKALFTSAHQHNLAMVKANTLSHQLPGEASLGARVTAAGYTWSGLGENIAWNGNRSQAGVLALETSMYNETAPNDGHRRNILSASFTEVGVDVVDDSAHGRVWLTTDFGRPG